MSASVKITRFRCVTDTSTADQADLDWAALESLLTTHERRADKDGPGWSPATFAPGTPRKDDHVIEVGALVLDIDKQPDGQPLDESGAKASLQRLRNLGLRFAFHTTHSHKPPEQYSLRAVVALTRAVSASDWRRFYKAAAKRLGFHVEPKCLNESRFWYLPAAKPDAPVVARSIPGEPLDVDAILAAAHVVEPSTPVDSERRIYPPATPEVLAAAQRALETHGPAIQGQGGDKHTLDAATKLRHDFGLTADEALPLLLLWNLSCVPPWPEHDLRAKSRDRYPHATGAYGAARERLPGGLYAPLVSEPAAPTPTTASGRARLASEIAASERPAIKVYTSGFPALDRHIGGGFATRTVTAEVARTGAGKSGLIVSHARHIVKAHPGTPFLWGSTELDREECLARLAAHVLGVSARDVLLGNVPAARARDAVAGLDIYVLGSEDMGRGQRGLDAFADEIKLVSDRHGVAPVVALDYLQNLALQIEEDDSANSRLGVSAIADRLRQIARDTASAIIAVSSTGRGFYKPPKDDADDPLTYLGAAKESGDVEFAVANLIFLDVAIERDPDGSTGARLVVAKARAGETGFVGARFQGRSGRWVEDTATASKMTAGARAERKRRELSCDAEAKVLARVEALSAKGKEHLQARRTLKKGHGIGEHTVADAIERMVADGRLVELPSRKGGNHPVLGLPSDAVPRPAGLPDPSLASWPGVKS